MESEEHRLERKLKEKRDSFIRQHTCKQCGKEPRQDGSSRGKKCAEAYRVQQANDARLMRKIEATVKN